MNYTAKLYADPKCRTHTLYVTIDQSIELRFGFKDPDNTNVVCKLQSTGEYIRGINAQIVQQPWGWWANISYDSVYPRKSFKVYTTGATSGLIAQTNATSINQLLSQVQKNNNFDKLV